MADHMRVRLAGPDAARLSAALTAAGFDVAEDAATVIHVTLSPPDLDGIEDAITGWAVEARRAAVQDGDVITVLADALIDGEDVAACSAGHGLVSATRAYAMQRERAGDVGNVVVMNPGDHGKLDAAAATVAFLVAQRALSGEVLHTGDRRHGRQRL